ncbi:hypothetical protein [Streptomyces glomeratus]|uniref:GH26 domain-containing protein n=1 Tax=Streptomyces glomeratus TaxID=284452 RepID=A0ABP6LWQ9_9ACTN|nr:hypothetical protein [Streptomyces glomeratus]MCF1511573.1 hypothetical protein [Streptomyces glomeratus]
MNKLVRRIITASASAVFVGGALFATGGLASAATPHPAGPTPAPAVVVQGGHGDFAGNATVNGRVDPWITDQLTMFDQWAGHRPGTYDAWITDQLALFAAAPGAAGQPSLG